MPDVRITQLPAPRRRSAVSLEEAIRRRRSVREYRRARLSLDQVSCLLWAAQGETDSEDGLRAAPSAGACYPLEAHLVAGTVKGLDPGSYRYLSGAHSLELNAEGDLRARLARAALRQEWVRQAPASIVLAAIYRRTTSRYGRYGVRYVLMDAGHAAQNLLLEAVALGLGGVVVAAFHEDDVRRILGIPRAEKPLCILPIGRPLRR